MRQFDVVEEKKFLPRINKKELGIVVGIPISEGFITCHPKLPEPVKGLLEPIACIPQSVKDRVSSPLKPSLICLVPHAVFKSERKGNQTGSLYHAENQLLGAFRCMLDAQKIAKVRVDNELPVLPLGMTNVGNLVSFRACWPKNKEGVSSIGLSLICRSPCLLPMSLIITCLRWRGQLNLFFSSFKS
jgi:hypothetical protein